ncbi:PilW family protein [Vibrio breoganii]|uniref:PilW family protein n=1 Tax=Vibrio breoganii TaxID=553239 RepID=UPI0021C2E97A|nr:prepilin-type N-terminal cleavage/methylation domain-containing protein [Vibrio breoganii]MDN3717328.1 prepilin-type N-terminal cleavage/methylation domain-containing protein [Vibrio breoganii]
MKQRGFTLIEMIVTIVVVAIIFLGIAGFVEFGTKGYTISIDRQRIQNQARFAIEKMSREIQHAVPNSFAMSSGTSGKCIEFYPIQYAGFYVEREATNTVEFVVGNEDYKHPHTFTARTKLVINPSRMDDLETGSSQSVDIGGITTATDGEYFSVTMNPDSQSSANRHFIYQDQSVTYCITQANELRRNGVQVASEVMYNQSSFNYEQTSLQRGGLIHLSLLFQNGDEQSQYKHDVQVSNVP